MQIQFGQIYKIVSKNGSARTLAEKFAAEKRQLGIEAEVVPNGLEAAAYTGFSSSNVYTNEKPFRALDIIKKIDQADLLFARELLKKYGKDFYNDNIPDSDIYETLADTIHKLDDKKFLEYTKERRSNPFASDAGPLASDQYCHRDH